MIWIWLVFVLLHILICIYTFLGIESGALNVHRYMFFVVVLLPFWGFLCVLLLHTQKFLKLDNNLDIGVEKLRLESELYKSVDVDSTNNSHKLVPMEEALIINNSKERRSLIMDILNDNPREYIEFLQKAGNNDDTEVVHYAVTAMVEISKENDYMMQKLERRYEKNPDDYNLLCEYTDFLWDCLEQNLMQGQVEIVNRNLFDKICRKKLMFHETKEDYIRLIKNNMSLGNYTQAGSDLDNMDTLWHETEEIVLLRLNYYAAMGQGKNITKLIDEIDREHIYLSASAKEEIAFWKE